MGVGLLQSMSFCHRNHFFVFRNEHAQSTTLGPKLMLGVVSRNFVAARHSFRKRVSRCIQSTSFCHRNRFFVFHNEHAQSTTLGPKLMFGVVSRNFVAARHPFRKRVSGCIERTSFCHRINFFVLRNEYAQSTNFGPKLMFGVVSRNFVAARQPFRKRVSRCIQSTSFCHRINFFVFRNEHSQSTTLGPKLMFGVVSRNFVAARHPFRKRVSGWVSGCIQARVFATGSIYSFFATNMPNPLLQVQNTCLGWFRAISLPHVTHSENGCRGAYKHEFLPPEPFLCFSQRTFPIHYVRSKTHVLMWFRAISLPHVNHSENGCRGAYKARVFATGSISSFFATDMPIHYFRSKTHVWGDFA
jgi:hypothetical protein